MQKLFGFCVAVKHGLLLWQKRMNCRCIELKNPACRKAYGAEELMEWEINFVMSRGNLLLLLLSGWWGCSAGGADIVWNVRKDVEEGCQNALWHRHLVERVFGISSIEPCGISQLSLQQIPDTEMFHVNVTAYSSCCCIAWTFNKDIISMHLHFSSLKLFGRFLWYLALAVYIKVMQIIYWFGITTLHKAQNNET